MDFDIRILSKQDQILIVIAQELNSVREGGDILWAARKLKYL
jgi:hypothetical protein